MYLIVALILNILSLVATAYIVPGFSFTGFPTLILAAIIIGVLNTFIRPFLLLITLPINIITLGLFTFVVNAVILMLASFIVPGFSINGFGTALLGAIVLAVISTALSIFKRK